MPETTDPLIEAMALAMINRDRNAGGWPSVKSRDNIENSHGYLECAQAAHAVVKQHLTWPESVERAGLALAGVDALVKAARACVPVGICLTNQNVHEDTVVPIEAAYGELRNLVAALSAFDKE